MTIPASPRRMPAVATNGVTTVFTFDFKVFADNDVSVTWETSVGTQVPLVLNTDYTVTRNPNQNTSPGGTITTTTALSAGNLAIFGGSEYKQETDIPNAGPFFGDSIESALDYLAILTQQLKELIGRALKVSPVDAVAADLPSAAVRASRYLAFDAFGNPIAALATPGSVSVTPWAETLLDDTGPADGRATLGSTVVGDALFVAASVAVARSVLLTIPTARILGRTTAGTGTVEELTVSAPLTLAAGALGAAAASTTAQGVVELATTSETLAGVDALRVVSPFTLVAVSLGHGQTWQNLTASRAFGVTYTNSTNRPIFVVITGTTPSGANGAFTVTVNGVIVAENGIVGNGGSSGQHRIPTSVIVPPGGTYSAQQSVATSTLDRWVELR